MQLEMDQKTYDCMFQKKYFYIYPHTYTIHPPKFIELFSVTLIPFYLLLK